MDLPLRKLVLRFAIFLAVACAGPLAFASEIGDYLNARNWQAPASGGLRVDSLAEDTTYSSRFRGEPKMGWFDHRHSFYHWMPPLVIPHFAHSAPDDPRRHIGKGQPLEGTSWRNRAYHVGWLFGGLYGDDIVDQQLEQANDLFGGYRFGWDFDHYWGCEGRVAWARLNLTDTESGSRLQAARNVFWDANLAYYPWGDSRWRPYGSIGLGWADFTFADTEGRRVNDQSLTMPIAIGVKYYWKKFMSFRAEAVNNMAFSSDRVDTMHSLSLTLGIEYRFGPPHRVYSW